MDFVELADPLLKPILEVGDVPGKNAQLLLGLGGWGTQKNHYCTYSG
jgi:hypothetical protein